MVVPSSVPLMLQLIIKQILLDNTCLRTVISIVKATRIILIKQLPDMCVNRECLHMMKSEETHAISHLRPHSVSLYQLLHSLCVTKLWQKRQQLGMLLSVEIHILQELYSVSKP